MKTQSEFAVVELTEESLASVSGGIDIDIPSYRNAISEADWDQFCRELEEAQNKPPRFF